MLQDKPYTLDRIFRLGMAVAMLAGLIWLVGYLSDALIPFAVALIMAYILNPVVEWLQKGLRWRGLAVAATLVGIVAFLALVIWVVAPMIANEVTRAGKLAQEMVSDSALAQRAAEKLPPDIWQSLKDWAAQPQVREILSVQNLWKVTEGALSKVLPGVWGLVTGTANLLLGLAGLSVVLMYLIFLLLDFRSISQGWAGLIPPNWRDRVTGFLEEFESAMSNYFRGQVLVAGLVGVIAAIGFALIGLPLGILLGMLLGVLNLVPYLGLLAIIPAAFLGLMHSLETGMSIFTVYGLILLVLAVVQVIQDGFLVPKIMGKVIGLSPWVILLSLSVWGKLLGLLGLIIALPATFLVLAYYRRLVLKQEA